MDYIRLKFAGISEIGTANRVTVLILTNVEGTRAITIVCDRATGEQLSLRYGSRKTDTTGYLPEVMSKIIREQTMLTLSLEIVDVSDGEYQARLVNRASLVSEPIAMACGLLLALAGDFAILVSKDLFDRQSIAFDPASDKLAVPLNSLSEQLLQEALEEAIRDEKYEFASSVRDELKKRRENAENQDNK